MFHFNFRDDYYVDEASGWTINREIDRFKDEILENTGIDITSASDRERIICRAFS